MNSTNPQIPDNKEQDVVLSQEEATRSSPNTTQAVSATTNDLPSFGWSSYAERMNGRFAMIGFTAILLVEAISGSTFLHWAGLVQ